jgi:RHS repeat-associated protein
LRRARGRRGGRNWETSRLSLGFPAVTNGSTNYPKWGLSWTYDRYGNRTAQTVTAGSAYSNSVTVNTSTNQIVGPPYAYDANGNMTNDGSNTLVYDAENRLLSATNGGASGSYSYDGKNIRVEKVSGSTSTVYIFSGSRVIAEYDNGAAVGSPSREYVYSGGHLLAKMDSSGIKYYHQDRLSNRLVTDSSGNTLAQLGAYPYGDTWYNAINDKLFFTSYERDSESGNDYAMMRYGVNRLARFSSPDPLAGSRGNPQSLNRYAYVHNDPINLTDPIGLIPGGPPKYECSNLDPVQMPGCGTPADGGGGGGGMACYMDGILSPCGIVEGALGAGAAMLCPNNICEGVNGEGQFVQFRAFADGSSGYLPYDSPVGYSVQDIANASSAVAQAAQGNPIDPNQLTGRAKQVYDLLIALGISPDNISIYQNGTQSFAAVLTDEGFEELQDSGLVDSNWGDVFLHYPYTDGGRSDQTPSLHYVWFDENLTDYIGGAGVYMQFHADNSNPWNGGFWQHWGCDVLHLTCH